MGQECVLVSQIWCRKRGVIVNPFEHLASRERNSVHAIVIVLSLRMIQHKKYTMVVLQHYVNSITFLLNIWGRSLQPLENKTAFILLQEDAMHCCLMACIETYIL